MRHHIQGGYGGNSAAHEVVQEGQMSGQNHSLAQDATWREPTIRVRDSEFNSADFDPETGEFVSQSNVRDLPMKRAADAWVDNALKRVAA